MARSKKKTRKSSKSRSRKWTLGDYARYIKAAKKEGLTVEQSRVSYRQMRGRLGRAVFASDIGKHPRDFEQISRELVAESKEAEALLEELIEDAPENIQTLFDRHYGDPDYDFDPTQADIIKVSISTKKTRKSFSVKLA